MDNADPVVHYLGINIGVVPIVNDIMSAIMSHPAILDRIGKPALENAESIDYSDGISVQNLLRPIEGTGDFEIASPRRVPFCDVRSRHVWLLTSYLMDYLFLHESAHIVCGHTNYARSRGLQLNAQANFCSTLDDARESNAKAP